MRHHKYFLSHFVHQNLILMRNTCQTKMSKSKSDTVYTKYVNNNKTADFSRAVIIIAVVLINQH